MMHIYEKKIMIILLSLKACENRCFMPTKHFLEIEDLFLYSKVTRAHKHVDDTHVVGEVQN